jgi:hypothetical protein
VPVGTALVGPVAAAIGLTETLWICLIVMRTSWLAILALPSVWAIRRPPIPAATAA